MLAVEIRIGSSLTVFLAAGHEFYQIEYAFNNRPLKFVATLVTQDAAEEGKHPGLFAREFQAQCSDRLDDGDLEFVCDICHKTRDLLHESVHAAFITGLK